MIKYPLVRVVFDRKKTATKQKAALVQVEVQMNGRKKYLSTGVKVYRDQWSLAHGGVVNSVEAEELNARVAAVKKQVDGYIAERQMKGEVFDFGLFGEWIRRKEGKSENVSFIDWVEERIERVRDLFLMQCYTGLAYSDLMDFDWRRVDEERGRMILRGCRRKTGMEFMVVLTDKALEILERYGYALPKISNEQYNLRLKVVADAAGIDKPIASHWGRRTCGMYLLNHGVRMEVVSKVLGHSSIKTTEQTYARILSDTVIDAFEGMK